MMRLLTAADRAVAFICKWGMIGALLGLSALLLFGVPFGSCRSSRPSGYDEIVELLVVWLTMLGALALWREGGLYRVVALENMAPPRGRRVLALMHHLLMLGVALVLVWKGGEFVRDSGETLPFLGIDKAFWYLALPVPGAAMAAYSLAGIVGPGAGGTRSRKAGRSWPDGGEEHGTQA
jgi:TRAP-type C4-dicarboxylate transport system permease small subunit